MNRAMADRNAVRMLHHSSCFLFLFSNFVPPSFLLLLSLLEQDFSHQRLGGVSMPQVVPSEILLHACPNTRSHDFLISVWATAVPFLIIDYIIAKLEGAPFKS